jgi:glycosyltransferase involved in cell wall biosynthesis
VPEADHTFAVPAYGESPYLEACLRSLTTQTVRSRVIVTTSTPSPFLSAVAARFGCPLVVNERRAGIASDWSFAYRNAGTRYVTLAHQDDLYAPDYACRCLAAAARYPDALMVFTDASELVGEYEYRRSRTLSVKRSIVRFVYAGREAIGSRRQKARLLAFGNSVSCPTVCYHRERMGEFRFTEGLAYNLDWDAWQRLAARDGSFVYVRQALVAHRIHAGATLVKGTVDESRKAEDVMMFRRFWPKPVASLLMGLYSLAYGTSRHGAGKSP